LNLEDVMNKLSPGNLFVAAALFVIVADTAWAQEPAPSAPATKTEQAASPGTGYAPYWQPPRWHEPPPPPPPPDFYDHYRPYYPPYPQYRAAPAENPLKSELKQTEAQLAAKDAELNTANEQLTSLQTEQQVTREALKEARAQLAAKITELDTAMEQLTGLQAEQQATREVMHQAQTETAKASEQLSVVVEEMDILYEVLSKLKERLDLQKTSLQGAVEAGAEENGPGESAVKGETEAVQSPTTPPAQPGEAGGTQTEKGNKEQAGPEVGEQI
jgi:hypothetical protein